MNELEKKKLNDIELMQCLLISIEFLYEWLEGYDINDFKNDLKTNDAVRYRISCIPIILNMFKEKKERESILDDLMWVNLSILDTKLTDNEIWDWMIGNSSIDPLIHYYHQIYYLYKCYYLNEKGIKRNNSFQTTKIKSQKNKLKNIVKLSNDFKYPIKTSKSIWTVKKL